MAEYPNTYPSARKNIALLHRTDSGFFDIKHFVFKYISKVEIQGHCFSPQDLAGYRGNQQVHMEVYSTDTIWSPNHCLRSSSLCYWSFKYCLSTMDLLANLNLRTEDKGLQEYDISEWLCVLGSDTRRLQPRYTILFAKRLYSCYCVIPGFSWKNSYNNS